jgi:hypothetical protein
MALRGQAAVVFWSEMEDAAAVDHWYAPEHLQERLQIPGFLRARRCVRELGSPSYLMICELSDTAVLTSSDYLARLNNPTPWTKQIMATARSANRTFAGSCVLKEPVSGAYLLTARVDAIDGPGSVLTAWMAQSLADLAKRQGITCAGRCRRVWTNNLRTS